MTESTYDPIVHFPKVWTLEDFPIEDYSREDASALVTHLNENGVFSSCVAYLDDPHPAIVRFFCTEHKGYYYDADLNHSGCLYVTEDAFTLYGLNKEDFEDISEFMDDEDIVELNEDRDKKLTYMFIIDQYWAVYGPDFKRIDELDWSKVLSLDCEPYEDEFVLAINGLPQALIEDTDNCLVTGWCDG